MRKLKPWEREYRPLPLIDDNLRYQRLQQLIDWGLNVTFENQVKRIDGEFVVRVVWKAAYNDLKLPECRWDGWATARGAMTDFLRKFQSYGPTPAAPGKEAVDISSV